MIELTLEHFDAFCDTFDSLTKSFGLTQYSLRYEFVALRGKRKGNGAQIQYNVSEAWAIPTLNKRPYSDVSLERCRRFAAHEFCHLFLAPLVEMVHMRSINLRELDQTVEGLCNRFAQAFYPGNDRLAEPEPLSEFELP